MKEVLIGWAKRVVQVGSVDYHCMAQRSMAALASPLSQAESMRREWTD